MLKIKNKEIMKVSTTADDTTSIQTIAKPTVSRRFLVRMSNKKLADVMYAILITKSKLTSSYGAGIY